MKNKLNILFEDDYLIILNKPIGLVTHPGSGKEKESLSGYLKKYTNNLSTIGGSDRPGIVHRLDKDTSGLLVIAKTNEVHEVLASYFKNDLILREYTALIDGVFPNSKAKIDLPIGRSDKSFKKKEIKKSGKESITYLEVIKRYSKNTLIKLKLKTGRTHQIRVHMSHIGYPITNDPVYGIKKHDNINQILEATKIEFVHPITKKEMSFSIELNEEFQKIINNLD